MSLNPEAEAQFREAAKSAACVADIAKKLRTWPAATINHFNEKTGIKLPFQRPDPDPASKALPPAQGRPCPKPLKKGAKPDA